MRTIARVADRRLGVDPVAAAGKDIERSDCGLDEIGIARVDCNSAVHVRTSLWIDRKWDR